MPEEKTFKAEWNGRELTFKTGRLAKQADAAVTVQYGETVVLATVVVSKEERDIDYFPLMVDFEERLYAAGVIKGSQWIKREGRPTDDAVLSGRMIDRSIRPLFDDSSRKETQVILTILSADGKNDHDIVALVAASAALSISGAKWHGPIAGIRVGRIDGKLIFNPTYEEREKSDMDVVVAGSEDKIIQIEAEGNEIKEDEMYEALIGGRKAMAPAIKLIKEMKDKIGLPTPVEEIDPTETDEEKENKINKQKNIELAEKWLKDNINKTLFDKSYYEKKERKGAVVAIKKNLDLFLFEKGIEKDDRKLVIKKTVEKAVDSEITRELIENKRRVDGREITEVREILSEVDILPRTHGSGLFSRGETQILSVITLAGPGLAQSLEGMEGTGTKRFMHHYNFAPFSVGEARFMRGPGRREVGHGALAEKALIPVLPSKEEFPYTIRVVSETMGSNGSSSMGSTCGSSLALMNAGVPLKKAVAGVAIGLASYDDMSNWVVLTDIQDLEDGKGGMDFKVTGTRDGVTAIQLDTKTLGLPDEVIKQALTQGFEGRLGILNTMDKAITTPNKELSPHAPRIISFKVDPEKIGSIIGPGGKIINAIIDETGVSIDIEDDGLVVICGTDQEKSIMAEKRVKDIVKDFEAGEIYKGKVVRILDFGVFVELTPGRDGLVHVSELAPYRINKPSDFISVGDAVTVHIKEIDEKGRVNLTMKGMKENEPLWKDKKGESVGNNFSTGNNRGNYNRGPRDNNKR
ncbi:polyribonucleotide nucleotidyltransferase [bacterium]|nr:polyribonucleotide nucleotidyltransferase [bacterium]